MKRDEILQKLAATPQPGKIEIPEWGGSYQIRKMTGAEVEIYHVRAYRLSRAMLICMCLLDENGERIFRDEDFAAVANTDPELLDRIYEAICSVNGIGIRAGEQAEKN